MKGDECKDWEVVPHHLGFLFVKEDSADVTIGKDHESEPNFLYKWFGTSQIYYDEVN